MSVADADGADGTDRGDAVTVVAGPVQPPKVCVTVYVLQAVTLCDFAPIAPRDRGAAGGCGR